MTAPPHFHTERLILRPPRREDVPSWTRHFADYEVIRHLADSVPWPFPQGGVEYFLRNEVRPRQGRDRWLWGLFLKDSPDEMIGALDLYRPGNPENRGFWLGKAFWGWGLMTEAVAPTLDFAFAELGFERLVFSNAVGNDRSRRIKEKTGARLIAIQPRAFVDPAYTEQEVWEMERTAWLANKQP
jgi:ribosomal-protein-alanine N-acetyltransferase